MIVEVDREILERSIENENLKREHLEYLVSKQIVYDSDAENSGDPNHRPKWKLNCYWLAKHIYENYHVKTFLKDKKPEFYIYNGKIYREYSIDDMRENIAFNGVIRKNGIIDIDEINQLWIKKSVKDQFFEAIKSISAVNHGLDTMERDNRFIALNNGLYDWGNDRLLDFSPEYWITNILPYKYVPNAECPYFDRFIHNICKYQNGDDDESVDHELKQFLLMFMGFIFITMKEKKMALFFKGDSDSGKSVLFNVMKGLVGNNNVSNIRLDRLNKRFALTNIVGKYLNVHAETMEEEGNGTKNAKTLNKIIQSQIFKCLTGDDTVEIERKGRDPFDYDNTAKLVFGMNNVPKFKDSGGGLTNRIWFIELQNTFEEGSPDRIEGIKNLILDELSGVFNKVMQALRELKEYDFVFPNRDKFRISDDFTALGNFYKSYAMENFVLAGEDYYRVIDRDIYEHFIEWYHQYIDKFDTPLKKVFEMGLRENVGKINGEKFKVVKRGNRYHVIGWRFQESNGINIEDSGNENVQDLNDKVLPFFNM